MADTPATGPASLMSAGRGALDWAHELAVSGERETASGPGFDGVQGCGGVVVV